MPLTRLHPKKLLLAKPDGWLLFAVLSLAMIGIIMVSSASISIADKQLASPFYYLFRQGIHMLLGFLGALVIVRIPMSFWFKYAPIFLLSCLLFLILVLVPGVGRTVNGSSRWLMIGPVGFQVSEYVKLITVIYMASYLTRHLKTVQTSLIGFIKPLCVLGVIALFLLLEPDFGASVVIISTVMGMLFLAGVPLINFICLGSVILVAFIGLAVSAPYRMMRLTSFMDPWADQFDSGYQLTQALIAFGRGEWIGVGLGSSIAKLFYLPEAHTDFLFAVMAEELGLLAAVSVLGLYMIFAYRGMLIGLKAQGREDNFSASCAFGITMWLTMQAMINIGVNTGVLPTKGLTLPLMSYGGSSILIVILAIAILFRIDVENKLAPNKRHF